MDNRTLLEDVRDALKPFAERAGVEYVLGRDETPAPDTHVIGNELMLQILDLRRARDALSRVEAALAEKKENTPMTDEQIKHMVDRFLQWKLPEDFRPDGGIEFDPISSKGTAYERRREPVGTNLLSATQAEAMVRHMLDGLPALAETGEEKRDIKDAPRDGSLIWAHVRSDLPASWPEQEDGSISAWADRWVPIKHGGVIDRSDEGEDPIDLVWTVALPVGYGGLPDHWFDDWMPAPRAAIAAMGDVR